MKISTLIRRLETVKEKLGDVKIIVTGCYGSCTDDVKVIIDKEPDKNKDCCIIQTDLMTG